jgi:hypothetical protein
MRSARSDADAILASSSPSSVVVKRIAPAMVWRWMKAPPQRASSSPAACGTSTKKPMTLLCLIRSVRQPVSAA